MATVESIMARDVVCINMDATLGKALALCAQKQIRHLPVLDENGCLAGLVTDRDLKYFVSPRIGTISENNADRESLERHVHVIMVRQVISTFAETPLAEAAQSMLMNRVGCLPVIDKERHVIGLLTTTDFVRYVAQGA
jgi:acetoin utilization protein AcuB